MSKKSTAKKSPAHVSSPSSSPQQSNLFWFGTITLALILLSLSVVLVYFEVRAVLEQLAVLEGNLKEIKQEASISPFCSVETPQGKIYGVNERKAIPNCLEVEKNETPAYSD